MIRCLKHRPLLLASTPTDGRNQCPCTYFDLPKELMATLGCLSHYGYKGLSERMLGRDEVFVSASESIQIAIVWECSELSPWPSIASAAREDKIPRHVNVDAQPSCIWQMIAGIRPWARSLREAREPVPLFLAGSRASTWIFTASAMGDAFCLTWSTRLGGGTRSLD